MLVAEIGHDVSRFPTARHLGAWAGLAPGNRESGGKAQAATTRKGNRYLRRCLVQAALAAARTRGSYLKALYHELGAEYFDQLDRERTSARLLHRLERLGFTVTLTEPTPATNGAASGP